MVAAASPPTSPKCDVSDTTTEFTAAAVTAKAAADLVLDRLDARFDQITRALESIERALYGEGRSGFVGLVDRVGMEEKAREDGDKAIRDEVAQFRAALEKLEKRFDRMIWIAIGVGLGSGAAGAAVANALTGGTIP